MNRFWFTLILKRIELKHIFFNFNYKEICFRVTTAWSLPSHGCAAVACCAFLLYIWRRLCADVQITYDDISTACVESLSRLFLVVVFPPLWVAHDMKACLFRMFFHPAVGVENLWFVLFVPVLLWLRSTFDFSADCTCLHDGSLLLRSFEVLITRPAPILDDKSI